MLWAVIAFGALVLAVYTAYTMGQAEERSVAWLDGYAAGRAAEVQRRTALYQIVRLDQYDEAGAPAAEYKPINVN